MQKHAFCQKIHLFLVSCNFKKLKKVEKEECQQHPVFPCGHPYFFSLIMPIFQILREIILSLILRYLIYFFSLIMSIIQILREKVEKSRKKNANSTQCSQAVTHPSTEWA